MLFFFLKDLWTALIPYTTFSEQTEDNNIVLSDVFKIMLFSNK